MVQSHTRQPPPGQPLDFLQVLAAKDSSVEVTLGGQTVPVRRARVGLAMRLLNCLSLDDRGEAALRYVSLASGVDEDDIRLDEIAPAFYAILQLNDPVGHPALVLHSKGAAGIEPAFRYAGRSIVALVHDLAFAYGWTQTYILEELCVEEAWCYLQEIHRERFEEQRLHYTLSSLGRDRRGRQKPLRVPAWFNHRDAAADRSESPGPAPAGMRPTGTVHDLNELARQRRNR